jgi:DNA-3-methyladenine glycosylase
VVCGPDGEAAAVLIRALEPLTGVDEMWQDRRAARREEDLCNGPAKLCQALGITGADTGLDLLAPLRRSPPAGQGGAEEVRLLDDGTPPPRRPGRGPRIGITQAKEKRWRFWVPGSPSVSRG